MSTTLIPPFSLLSRRVRAVGESLDSKQSVVFAPAFKRGHFYIRVWRDDRGISFEKPQSLARCPDGAAELCTEMEVEFNRLDWCYEPAEPAKLHPFMADPARDTRAVYFVEAVGLHLVKIGIADDVQIRFENLQCVSPVPLLLVGYLPGLGRDGERELHSKFRKERSHGEWFHLTNYLYHHIAIQLLSAATPCNGFSFAPDFWVPESLNESKGALNASPEVAA